MIDLTTTASQESGQLGDSDNGLIWMGSLDFSMVAHPNDFNLLLTSKLVGRWEDKYHHRQIMMANDCAGAIGHNCRNNSALFPEGFSIKPASAPCAAQSAPSLDSPLIIHYPPGTGRSPLTHVTKSVHSLASTICEDKPSPLSFGRAGSFDWHEPSPLSRKSTENVKTAPVRASDQRDFAISAQIGSKAKNNCCAVSELPCSSLPTHRTQSVGLTITQLHNRQHPRKVTKSFRAYGRRSSETRPEDEKPMPVHEDYIENTNTQLKILAGDQYAKVLAVLDSVIQEEQAAFS
ncbi:hypothetical protein SARC_04025 [Sphaeroforma arctica JP610]|uniref:Uncharacterized protein n=1 Tax=Sphaeroforma arctica JP610 TaxID=667725 RepID=A0A0L0G4D5_9EUKA|nr:hypothetical protein SARC_04025 [Sphaeroforma arctica JP610]KNC83749.1 hypothetical protein SARC_04025 [Sphaeroforma arctica JP610]|eukprot:XP_014157651.1 hypothetical protein SARC_04025 [Sphaeroforma arctica JP610]